jgi:hypothetical protein
MCSEELKMSLGVKYFVRVGTRIHTCMYKLIKDLLCESFVLLFYLELAVARLQLREVDQRRGSTSLSNINSENLVVVYNRVPKTGSTSFVGVAYDLCKKNGFHVLHINITGNMHALSLKNQVFHI